MPRNRSRLPIDVRFWKFVNKTDSCWLWTGAKMHFGYGAINSGGHYGRALRAHRVSWEIHNGPIPADLFVLHHCDVPSCVNPKHLFLGDDLANNRDMTRKGRRNDSIKAKGTRHWGAKLLDIDITEIRQQRSSGMGLRSLSERHGVSMGQISRIALKQSWKHI